MLGVWFAITSELLLKDRIIKLAHDIIYMQEKRLAQLFYVSLGLMVSTWTMQVVNYQVVL